MTCGAALYFDAQTDAAVRGLWRLIEEAGLPAQMQALKYPPHMTILTCENMRFEALRDQLEEFITHQPPLTVQFHSLGVFKGDEAVIYLAPVTTRPLLDFHARLWEIIAPYSANPNALYQPGSWVPHVTLDLEVPLERAGAVLDLLLRVPRPRAAVLEALFLADYNPDVPAFQELFQARLGSALP